MMSSCTVEVSNLSTKVTAREIEEFFSYSGQIKNVGLKSDGEASRIAYVTFTDSIASETATLLSGSTILDQEVKVSMVTDSEQEIEGCELEDVRASEAKDRTSSPRPSAVSRAQDMVTSMLSRGFVLGKDVLKKARSFDEKRRMRSSGDKEDAQGSPSNTTTTPTTATSRARLVERWNKQVEALNEKLQIGQRATRALAMAQQGVTSAGTAVKKNSKWVSVAIASRVSRSSPETAAASSENLPHEQVQLTEMCSLKAEA